MAISGMDNNGIPIIGRDSNRGNQDSSNASMGVLFNNLNNTLQSISSEMSSIKRFLTDNARRTATQNAQQSRTQMQYDSSSRRRNRDNAETDFKDLTRSLSDSLEEAINSLTRRIESGQLNQHQLLEATREREMRVQQQAYITSAIQQLSNEIHSATGSNASISQQMQDISNEIEHLQNQLDIATQQSDRDALESRIQGLQNNLENLNNLTNIDRRFDDLNDELARRERDYREQNRPLLQFNRDFQDNMEHAASALSDLGLPNIMSTSTTGEDENKAIDNLATLLAQQMINITNQIQSIQSDIASGRYTDQAQLDAANAQLAELQRQDHALAEQQALLRTYGNNGRIGRGLMRTFSQQNVGKTLGNVVGNVLTKSLNNIFETLRNKYFDRFLEAFDRLYDSMESTRNEVSTRLKLDQGAFEEMENRLEERVKLAGYENVISDVDLNEAIVGISSAGIVDQSLLEQLAWSQAELKAFGSSFDLTNEESLKYIQQMYQNSIAQGKTQDQTLSELSDFVMNIATMEATARDQGYDVATVHGGANTLMNTAMNAFTAGGGTFAEAISDNLVEQSLGAGYEMQVAGIDPNVIAGIVNEMMEGKLGEGSTFDKMLNIIADDYGLNAETISKNTGQAMTLITQELQRVLTEYSANPEYLAHILDTYGLSMSVQDALRGINRIQETNRQELDFSQDRLDDIYEEMKKGVQSGDFKSMTSALNKQAENNDLVYEAAQSAQERYEGNEEYKRWVSIISDGIQSSWTFISNGLGSFVGNFTSDLITGNASMSSLVGSNACNFMTGASGTALGTAGKAVGGAVGTGIMIHAIADGINQSDLDTDSTEDVLLNVLDAEFFAGMGTVIGSAAAGPIGGAVGGAVGALSGSLGQMLADKATQEDEVYSELYTAANNFKLASIEELDAVRAQVEEYKNLSLAQKKVELVNQGKATAEELAGMSDEEVESAFTKRILTPTIEDVGVKEQGVAQAQLEESTIKALESYLDSYTGQIKHMKELEQSGSVVGGNITSAIGWDTYQDIVDAYIASGEEAPIEEYINKYGTPMAEDKFIETRGYKQRNPITEESLSQISEMLSMGIENRKKYDAENEAFQKRWQEIVANNPSASMEDIEFEYIKKWHPDETGFSLGVQRKDGKIAVDENGLPALSHNQTYQIVGAYKSGLSYVPYDEFPALLHEGERVLTKEEAQQFNKLSSDTINASEYLTKYFDKFDKLDMLDGLSQLDELDSIKELSQLDMLDKLDSLDTIPDMSQLDKLDSLSKLDKLDDIKNMSTKQEITNITRNADVTQNNQPTYSVNSDFSYDVGTDYGIDDSMTYSVFVENAYDFSSIESSLDEIKAKKDRTDTVRSLPDLDKQEFMQKYNDVITNVFDKDYVEKQYETQLGYALDTTEVVNNFMSRVDSVLDSPDIIPDYSTIVGDNFDANKVIEAYNDEISRVINSADADRITTYDRALTELMSSFITNSSSVDNSSTNTFDTQQLGKIDINTDKFETAVGNQTSTLSETLNKIAAYLEHITKLIGFSGLSSIGGVKNQNLLNMNTNVQQLTTTR